MKKRAVVKQEMILLQYLAFAITGVIHSQLSFACGYHCFGMQEDAVHILISDVDHISDWGNTQADRKGGNKEGEIQWDILMEICRLEVWNLWSGEKLNCKKAVSPSPHSGSARYYHQWYSKPPRSPRASAETNLSRLSIRDWNLLPTE